MEALTIHQLESKIAYCQCRINLCRKNLPLYLVTGGIERVAYAKKAIIKNLNLIAVFAAEIAMLKLKGETDEITTNQALSFLHIDYTYENGAFYIHS